MARPLRLEISGALYYITSRGAEGMAVFRDDQDREQFLQTLAAVCNRTQWRCHAYCLLNHHYHLLIETPKPNLAKGMRQFNGVYTQQFNRRHQHIGPIFQGRYKAIVAEKEAYLLRLNRHIVRNPIRLGLTKTALQWRWSSYRATLDKTTVPEWLEVEASLSQLAKGTKKAQEAYRSYIRDTSDTGIWDELQQQIYLGSNRFIKQLQRRMEKRKQNPQNSSLTPITSGSSLQGYSRRFKDRDRAISQAYLSGKYTLKSIGDHFDLHYTTISRIVKRYEQSHS